MSREYFVEGSDLDDILINAFKKSNEIWTNDKKSFENQYKICILHQDGSSFSILHCHYRWGIVNYEHPIECLIVFPEHNSIMIFPIPDLEYFIAIGFDDRKVIVFNEREVTKLQRRKL